MDHFLSTSLQNILEIKKFSLGGGGGRKKKKRKQLPPPSLIKFHLFIFFLAFLLSIFILTEKRQFPFYFVVRHLCFALHPLLQDVRTDSLD